MGKVKKASSFTASIALCALIPLNFLTAHGHTLPESQTSTDLIRNDVEDNRPTLQLPDLAPKAALLPPTAIINPIDGDAADDTSAQQVVATSHSVSVVTTRETGHASVYINHNEVIKFRSDAPNASGVWQTPTERAMASYSILKNVLAKAGANTVITPVVEHGHVYLTVNGQRFAEVDASTARQLRTTPQSLALVWTSKLKKAVHTETVAVKEKAPVKTAQQPAIKSSDNVFKGRFLAAGKASWYGPGFHGRRAANGTIFNQFAMTAAHKTLPFGTLVRVTNKLNGKQCVVKITDRGPFCGGRVIDLSRKAAESLGMLGSGVASVNIEAMPHS